MCVRSGRAALYASRQALRTCSVTCNLPVNIKLTMCVRSGRAALYASRQALRTCTAFDKSLLAPGAKETY
jgi:hypothetical protein